MTLTMTNSSSQNETVALGPSIDGFFVTQNAKVIWRSNSGVEPQYIVRRILKPGQSITLSAQWTIPASVSGAFVVHNELFPSVPWRPSRSQRHRLRHRSWRQHRYQQLRQRKHSQ